MSLMSTIQETAHSTPVMTLWKAVAVAMIWPWTIPSNGLQNINYGGNDSCWNGTSEKLNLGYRHGVEVPGGLICGHLLSLGNDNAGNCESK
jgi:hypothetical protein